MEFLNTEKICYLIPKIHIFLREKLVRFSLVEKALNKININENLLFVLNEVIFVVWQNADLNYLIGLNLRESERVLQ